MDKTERAFTLFTFFLSAGIFARFVYMVIAAKMASPETYMVTWVDGIMLTLVIAGGMFMWGSIAWETGKALITGKPLIDKR